jgi:hypothetical protein
MDNTVKKTIGIVLVVLIVCVAVYGTYLPMRKAEIFIATLQSLQTQPASSLNELESRLSVPLNYPSPIGQEELVRNFANSVLSFVQQSRDATSTGELIGFLNTYFNPILQKGKGMSFGQDLYLEGAINEMAFAQTGDSTYLMAAKQYYLEGNTMGPDRPQPLYGLFDVYRAMGDATDTVAVANKILTNWPTDTRIEQGLMQFLSVKASSTSVAPAKK